MTTNVPVVCGHCGRSIDTAARGWASGAWLCHTGTVPPSARPTDCYRLVTVYLHRADGSCCLAKALNNTFRRLSLLVWAVIADGGQSQGPAWCRATAALGLNPDLTRQPDGLGDAGA